MIRNRFSSRDTDIFEEEESLNPMESVANIADAMLVLAVGMMLALIMAWNVDISMSGEYEKLENADKIKGDDIVVDVSSDPDEQLYEMGLTEYGRVFEDEDGNYYVLKESDY